MKADVASPAAPEAVPQPAEAIPKLPQAADPLLPIMPGATARPPLADALIKAAPVQDFNLARDLGVFARVRAEGGRRVVAIFAASTVVTIANMFGQVQLNDWNGRFFDAVGRKDLSGFVHDLQAFVVIIAILLALTVANTYLQERLKFRLREWITRHLLAEWLKPLRVYQLGFAGEYGHNPDQRIQEDTRLLGDYTADLGCGIVYSLLQLIAFVGMLWTLSAQVTFQVAGYGIAIPGYMVWCALAYASIGSALTWIVGRPLIALNGERYAREAEFRFALVRVNESGESIALHGGETDERRHLEAGLAAVVDTMRRISTSLARLTWITSGIGWLSLVVPILVAAPAYFGGNLTLGGLIMVAGAFTQVQLALRWFVDNFSRLADWRAAVHRVARFREALDNLPAIESGAEEIKRALHPEGHLTFEAVRVLLPDGHIVIDDATVSITPGERVLIVGDTGRGKSTLFRAVAGLWPWGSGTILTPPPAAMAFLPQRPYLPLGTLRNALSYPSPPDAFLDADVRQALERCDLGNLIPKLDTTERWDKELSLGEQERLAFARLLLHKPGWVFLDEATAALDEDSQRRVMALFDDELKQTTVLSIGHRPDLAVYHTRTLQLVHGVDGDRLKLKPPPAPPPPRRWLQRLDDWLLTIRR
ncbi:putative ATP-binding cassette transporter [Bradyrhizobium diazoefficiens]|uniref:ATP-binding protein n=2 Tax=Bradyrhizobium diazoefficiens TaxID=1355477 RepID=A0A0E4BR53_9BRAD|nr:ABC transporter ATP-binding protein/permease [Bradyrhizobium diazoefficiens]MBR0861669.1 ABC transporter ATP-binding protein/permease [Bradyrhizobium diazoefficiens]MBR0886154.1 ABC transporter ATP-binding protein/permease [Bradyrhizobium diazoefficiens]MBR0917977.1 ABC transporter ATP-binding protein/permease [Bradyrhizobium diazoefficiens]BAR57888.1 ATP-binding protein [Bradyrhizobium diazoefficiens]